MFKRRSAILILISAFLVGGGYLNSEEIRLSSFTYYTAVNNFSPEANCYFSETADGTDDPNFTSTSLDTDKLNEPQYYMVVEKFGDVTVQLDFTPLSNTAHGNLAYTVSVDNNSSKSVKISDNTGSIKFTIPRSEDPIGNNSAGQALFRVVYGLVYSFDDLYSAVPGAEYSSTVTMTVSEGADI